ncbi:hypothetical protein SAMN02787142_1134 [Burkholderia sp. WP9]|nr:hypothetical protein SAMN02787142_1134 [Burkholderia sp. WP9]
MRVSPRVEAGPTQTERKLPGDRRLANQIADDHLRAPEYDSEYSNGEAIRGSSAIFGLIGAALASDTGESRRDRSEASSGINDLIETLHEQYRRVLCDPHASLPGGWEGQSPLSVDMYPASHYEAQSGARTQHIASIEALLSGARFMEDAFGPLAADLEGDFGAAESVPEILGLFAPEVSLAVAARRARVLPPALARRDHHALGLDSPLPAPRSMTHEETR